MRFISRLDYNFSDSGSVIAVATGAIICAVLVFVCVVVCCIQKYQNKRRNLPTHQRGIRMYYCFLPFKVTNNY